MLKFAFMRRALLVGGLLGLVLPLLGLVVVNRRMSTIGDALSHVSLSGVALALIMGINPTVGAIFATLIAAGILDFIRGNSSGHGDLATAIVMSLGIALASVLSDFAPGANSFESFLFGSIVAISDQEFLLTLTLSILIILISFYYYQALLSISIDEISARLNGVPVKRVNRIFTILLALAIAMSARTVGALLVSAILVIPVASAMNLSRSYKSTLIISSALGFIGVILGIFISYYLNLKPGGTIVIVTVIFYFISCLIKRIVKNE